MKIMVQIPRYGFRALIYRVLDFICYSIEGEYVPLPGDRVKFRVCPIPPKLEKVQAVHVEIIDFGPEVHKKWDCVEGT